MKMIERLCEDPAVNRLDFGFGDADYKRVFADESWTEQDVEVFGRRPRPLGINLVQTSIRGASAGRGRPWRDGTPRRRLPVVALAPRRGRPRGVAAVRRWLRRGLVTVAVLAGLVFAALGASAVLDRPARVMMVSSTVDAPKAEVWAVSRTSTTTTSGTR